MGEFAGEFCGGEFALLLHSTRSRILVWLRGCCWPPANHIYTNVVFCVSSCNLVFVGVHGRFEVCLVA